MIIIFNKKSGKIRGVSEGRIHSQAQKAAKYDFSDDPGNYDTIIIEWRPVIDPVTKQLTGDFEPNVPEEEMLLWKDLDEYPAHAYLYEVDPQTKKLKGKNSI